MLVLKTTSPPRRVRAPAARPLKTLPSSSASVAQPPRASVSVSSKIFHFDAALTVLEDGAREPISSTGHYANTAWPHMSDGGKGPNTREILELSRRSRITTYSSGGIFSGP